MIKITTTLLFFTLLFTACAERGTTLTPKSVEQKPAVKKTFICTKKSTTDTKRVQSETSKNVSSHVKSIVVVQKTQVEVSKSSERKTSTNNNDLFSFTEDTKNKISGFLVFLIGVMIFI